jgi:hypothetical protein
MIITSYAIQQPKEGDTREIKRWAWYRRVGSKIVVCQRYTILQCWVFKIYTPVINGKTEGFRVGSWVDLAEKIS